MRILAIVLILVACVGTPSDPAVSAAASALASRSESPATAAATLPTADTSETTIPGYGATEADWAARHEPDTRFEPGCCWDRTPGLGPDPEHDARYYAVLFDDGRVFSISERLPNGTSIGAAEAAALAEMPVDTKVLWRTTLDVCALAELESETLAAEVGHGGVLVSFYSGTGDDPFDPRNVIELIFLSDDSPTPSDAPGC